MTVITVRQLSDNRLVCFGPDNGMYSPGVPAGTVRATEPDYDTVLAEWQSIQTPVPQVKQFEGALKAIYANNLVALNTLMAKYPLFLWSLRDENWVYVKAMFQAAVQAGDITANDWTSIQAAATAKNIPIL